MFRLRSQALLFLCFVLAAACGQHPVVKEASLKREFYERVDAFAALGDALLIEAESADRDSETVYITYCPDTSEYCSKDDWVGEYRARNIRFEPLFADLDYSGYFFIKQKGSYWEFPNLGSAELNDFEFTYQFVFPISKAESVKLCDDALYSDAHVYCLIPLKGDWAIGKLGLNSSTIRQRVSELRTCYEEIGDEIACDNRIPIQWEE